jgi:hypothetical protein
LIGLQSKPTTPKTGCNPSFCSQIDRPDPHSESGYFQSGREFNPVLLAKYALVLLT